MQARTNIEKNHLNAFPLPPALSSLHQKHTHAAIPSLTSNLPPLPRTLYQVKVMSGAPSALQVRVAVWPFSLAALEFSGDLSITGASGKGLQESACLLCSHAHGDKHIHACAHTHTHSHKRAHLNSHSMFTLSFLNTYKHKCTHVGRWRDEHTCPPPPTQPQILKKFWTVKRRKKVSTFQVSWSSLM